MSDVLSKIKSQHDDFRCSSCNKLIGKNIALGVIEIKCPRCGTLNVAFDSVREQVVITDKEGFIIYMNPAAEEITGFSIEESTGKKPSQLWGNQMPKEFYRDMWTQMLEGKKPVHLSLKNKHKNGTIYTVELVVSPILNIQKEISFLVGIEKIIPDLE